MMNLGLIYHTHTQKKECNKMYAFMGCAMQSFLQEINYADRIMLINQNGARTWFVWRCKWVVMPMHVVGQYVHINEYSQTTRSTQEYCYLSAFFFPSTLCVRCNRQKFNYIRDLLIKRRDFCEKRRNDAKKKRARSLARSRVPTEQNTHTQN